VNARLILLALVVATGCGPTRLVEGHKRDRDRHARSVVENKERAKSGYVLISDAEYVP
jgi:hypothetical protein